MTLDVFLAIVFMTSLFVILKYFERWKINNLHGLTVNYLTASALSFLNGFSDNVNNIGMLNSFLPICLIMGVLFISSFYLTAFTAQRNGVSAATVASKMSVVIPVMAGIKLYNDAVSLNKFAALFCALAAVYFTGSGNGPTKTNQHKLLLPLILFLCAGIVDTTIKYAQYTYLNDKGGNIFIAAVFAIAGCVGLSISIYNYFKNKISVEGKSISAGMLLGTCNYASLIFVLNALGAAGADSGEVFTLSNVGVVLLSVICSFLLFKERLTTKGITGVVLALAAIVLLSFKNV